MRFSVLFVFALTSALSGFSAQLSEAEISAYGATYFAPLSILPCGVWRMRTPDGGIRLFSCPWEGEPQLKSPDGWTGDTDGEKSLVMTPPGTQPALKIFYEDGTPVSVEVDGTPHPLKCTSPVTYGGQSLPGISWPDFWIKHMRRSPLFERGQSWTELGRLRLWYSQPNQAGALFATLLALAVVLAFRAKSVLWRVLGISFSLLSLGGILLTQSRGSLVAAFVATCLVTACHFHGRGLLTGKRIALILLALVLAGGLAGTAFVLASHRGAENYRQSNQYRALLWKTFPRIMSDAPWGWGWGKVGAAYTDWYSAMDDWTYRRNLVNDHFTALAAFGWLGGGLYLLGWTVGLLGLLRLAWKGGTLVPLAAWSVIAVTSFFNVILSARTILWIPIACLVPLVFEHRCRTWRFWVLPVAVGLVCSSVSLLTVYGLGFFSKSALNISRKGGAVLVNGNAPKIWLVIDYDVLGSVLMTREEIRAPYVEEGGERPIGVVTDLDALGQFKVRRLVLSGRHCADFLRRHAVDGFRRGVPPEIVFLSPGFSASAIPPELRARSRVRFVMGEFAARYYPDMANPPGWVTLVKGAEVYIPGWFQYSVSTFVHPSFWSFTISE